MHSGLGQRKKQYHLDLLRDFMVLSLTELEIQISGSSLGLSARRLWDHTESAQINVFDQLIRSKSGKGDPTQFVDMISTRGSVSSLLGCTLHEWLNGQKLIHNHAEPDSTQLQSPAILAFIRAVNAHVEAVSERQGTRSQHGDFLPVASGKDAFGVPFIASALEGFLRGMGKTSADASQWEGTIRNFEKKGFRVEELRQSGLLPYLKTLTETGSKAIAQTLISACDFSSTRLSVIPVVAYAEKQLNFVPAPERRWKRAIKTHKTQAGQKRQVVEIDPVLGYRIEQIEHHALWGTDVHWLATSHDGRSIQNSDQKRLFLTPDYAATASGEDAIKRFPKRLALGKWNEHAWTGGKDYREWLVTLPYYSQSYFSDHFDVRNVLAHIRCDLRDGPGGEKVLLVHEVQSDWAKSIRDAVKRGEIDPKQQEDQDRFPPFWREWSSLTMKLVLLHAAQQGANAMAWTKGAHQVDRYDGYGAQGLRQLYDEILPREVNRLVKPFGIVCEELAVFVPENFTVTQFESGYEVHSIRRGSVTLLGIAPTMEDARRLFPDGGHESLYDVHGVQLSAKTRQAILATGFSAWG